MGDEARGYSWPPFEPGNQAAVRHGIYSPRKVDPLVTELLEQLVAHVTSTPGHRQAYLAEPQHRFALIDWLRTEARIRLLDEWLLDHGELDDEGEVAPASAALTRLQRLAVKQRAELGLSPASEAALQRSRAGATLAGWDLAAAVAKGQAVIEARVAGDQVVDAGDAGGIPEHNEDRDDESPGLLALLEEEDARGE